MDNLKSVADLKLTGNRARNWQIFKDDFEDFVTARNAKMNDAVKLALLRNQIGQEGKDIIKALAISDEDRCKYDNVIKALDEFFAPKTNILYERFVFYNRNQKENEPIDEFVKELQELVSSCNFENASEMLRDRVVFGVADLNLQEKLLKMEDIEVEKAITECRIYEKQKQQVRIVQEAKRTVDAIQGNTDELFEKDDVNEVRVNRRKSKNAMSNQWNQETKLCSRCFKTHRINNCPAFGKTCNKCKKFNHFAIACKSRGVHVNALSQGNSDNSDSSSEFALTYSIESRSKQDLWVHDIKICGFSVNFKLDTGSDANIIPLSTLRKIIKKPILKPSKTTLQTYSGHRINPIGQIILRCVVNDSMSDEIFLVVDDGYKPILSRDSCVKLGLIKRIYNVKNGTD